MLNKQNLYQNPSVQIVLFENEDILTLSNGGDGSGNSKAFSDIFNLTNDDVVIVD
ncbi:MAG: hypothetical protein IJW55_04765 [Clostridia bacterium]|nr:hypothetical protein [Clostridia bacterium]